MSTYKGIRDVAEFVIYGEPCSKANSRQHVRNKATGKSMFIKSKKALSYVKAFQLQCPQVEPPMSDDLKVTMTLYYASRRPDLDESVILDCMQSVKIKDAKTKKVIGIVHNIYENDRQVKEKHIFWALDKGDPRAVIKVETL
jgi:hypothetical protein